MAKNPQPKLPSDGELDRATDPEYAAISTMAVVALVLAVAGVASLVAGPLVIVPALATALGAVALHKIRRSDGVLTGGKLAVIAIILGGALTVASGGTMVKDWWVARQESTLLKDRSLAIVDEMIAGDYGKVWDQTAAGYRAQFASGVQGLRDGFAPQFEGAGKLLSRNLKSLLKKPYREDAYFWRAEVYVEFEKSYLNFDVWFRPMPGGAWQFEGVGVGETLESTMRFAEANHPRPVVGPYEERYTDEHHH